MTIAYAMCISEFMGEYKLDEILKIAKMAKSTFYWAMKNKDIDPDSECKARLKEIWESCKGRYGFRRMKIAYESKHGTSINKKKVIRLMKELGMIVRRRKGRYNSYKGEIGKTAPNIINRNFSSSKPNQKWTTDVTEFAFSWGKCYLSPILDMYNGEIIAYNLSRSPNYAQVNDMLNKAFSTQMNLEGLIFHSDQGWQYQMRPYQEALKSHGIIQSMSRKGNCLDNSVMENFFGRLKVEMFYDQKYDDFETFQKEIEDYLYWYNKERIKLRLKMSPEQFRGH